MEYTSKRKPEDTPSSYEGNWKDDRPHGLGTFMSPTSYETKYEGEWDSGKRSGKGTLTFSNGSKWEGNFEKNKVRPWFAFSLILVSLVVTEKLPILTDCLSWESGRQDKENLNALFP